MTTTEILREKLRHPDNLRRPVQIIHSYYPKTPAETEIYLDAAVKNGLGGFVVNMDVHLPRQPEETEEEYKKRSLDAYLGEGTPETDAEWEHLRDFIDACFARGMEVWIYDERAYPSGAAGHKVLAGHPEDQVKGLVCSTTVVGSGKGSMPVDHGRLRFAAAYPMDEKGILNINARILIEQNETEFLWDLPEIYNEYRVCIFYTRTINFHTENKVPYPDLMRADVVNRFIDVTHEAYLRHLGAERISKITAFFTDEPGLPTHGCSSYFYEKDAVAAWTEEMDDLLPGNMPEHYVDLFFETSGDFWRYRRKYWQCAAKLFGENYFGRIAAWCEEHGTRMTGHLYGEETLSMQIGLNSDLFGLMRYMQMPGVDRLYAHHPRDVIAEKTVSSAAHLYGRPFVMSESSFHLEYNWWKIPEEATCTNRLNSTYYQMQLGVTHIASYYGYNSAFDPERLKFEECAARAAIFCGTGTHVTDVLVLIPMNGAYERFAPPDHKYWDVGPCITAPHQPESIQKLEEIYGNTLEILENDKFDFDLIDEAGLVNCVAADGKIGTGYEEFRLLVLFDSAEPEPETACWIWNYLNCGGRMVVVKTDIESKFISETMEKYTKQIIAVSTDEISAACREAGISPLLNMMDECPGIRVRRTVAADADLWFVHNRRKENNVRICGSGEYTIFAMDGTESTVKSDKIFTLTLPEKSAVMMIRQKTEEIDEVR